MYIFLVIVSFCELLFRKKISGVFFYKNTIYVANYFITHKIDLNKCSTISIIRSDVDMQTYVLFKSKFFQLKFYHYEYILRTDIAKFEEYIQNFDRNTC